MWAFIRQRLVASVVALIGVVVVVFFLARLTGSPASLYLPVGASSQDIATFNHVHGYDQPVWDQFGRFVNGVVHLNFGQSLSQQRSAFTAVISVVPQTIYLAAVAMVVAIVIALAFGSLAASRKFSKVDNAISFVSIGLSSIPDFWFGLVAILILAVKLHLLPTSGQSGFSSWILPVCTLILAPVGVLTQVVRGAMIDALGSGYVMNAQARGYSRRRLVLRHALRNAALPIITVAGDKAAGMFNGAIIVGTVFAWPGIGTVVVNAVLNRDFSVIQAGVFVIGITIVLLNMIVDLTYALADPRVRLS
jgi:peptide/nickel transport system permease protein